MDKRQRLLKRKMARAAMRNSEGRIRPHRGATLTIGPGGTIIGRPKKPPIIGSEKTDGKLHRNNNWLAL